MLVWALGSAQGSSQGGSQREEGWGEGVPADLLGRSTRGDARVSGERMPLLNRSPWFLVRVLSGSTPGSACPPSSAACGDPRAVLRGRLRGAVQRSQGHLGTRAGAAGAARCRPTGPATPGSAESPSHPVPVDRPGAPAFSKRQKVLSSRQRA